MASSSSSSIRVVFGSLLCRVSNGEFFFKPPTLSSVQSTLLFREKLSSCSWYSSSGKWVSAFQLQACNSVRKFRTFSLLCMGRRSCKIAGGKTAQDAKKENHFMLINKGGTNVSNLLMLRGLLTANIRPGLINLVSSAKNYSKILSKVGDAGIPCESDNGSEQLPINPIELSKYNSLNLDFSHHSVNGELFDVDDKALDLNRELMSKLLELDDVDAV